MPDLPRGLFLQVSDNFVRTSYLPRGCYMPAQHPPVLLLLLYATPISVVTYFGYKLLPLSFTVTEFIM